MFEFNNVPIETFTDTTTGEIIQTKSIHFIELKQIDRPIFCNSRDYDQIALEELGSYDEFLNLCEQNAGTLVEYQLDISKINYLNIPK